MKFKSVLVTGCRGQVGYHLISLLRDRCDRLILTSRSVDQSIPSLISIDWQNESQLSELIKHEKPEIIFNCAAYTAVDRAETEQNLADRLNRHIPSLLAKEARKLGSLLVHFSTDYVFDGAGTHFRDETAQTSPLSVYGKTKLEGEHAIQESGAKHLIFRTSWVFSEHGHNFVKTMLKLGSERKLLKIVDDQIGGPTSAQFLAKASIAAAEKSIEEPNLFGLYHLCNSNITSWFTFALKIFEEAKKIGYLLRIEDVLPIATAEYPTAAQRPLNSRLDCGKFERSFGIKRPNWQDELGQTLSLLSQNR